MGKEQRYHAIKQFLSGQASILVTSDVASRGLDFEGVGHVVMFDFPRNAIDYLHRAGRTGRMGRKGSVTCLLSTPAERALAEKVQTVVEHNGSLAAIRTSFDFFAPNHAQRQFHLKKDAKLKIKRSSSQERQKRRMGRTVQKIRAAPDPKPGARPTARPMPRPGIPMKMYKRK